MESNREQYPPLWITVCRRAKLPASSSVDRVHAAYGMAAGRGSFQRIRAGNQPRMATLNALADFVGMRLDDYLRDDHEPKRPPADFSDRIEVSESDWALLQDIKTAALDEEIETIRKRARALEKRVEARLSEVRDKAKS